MHASNSNSSIALVTVAAEIGISADELAQRFGDAVVEDAAGIRCVATEGHGRSSPPTAPHSRLNVTAPNASKPNSPPSTTRSFAGAFGGSEGCRRRRTACPHSR